MMAINFILWDGDLIFRGENANQNSILGPLKFYQNLESGLNSRQI